MGSASEVFCGLFEMGTYSTATVWFEGTHFCKHLRDLCTGMLHHCNTFMVNAELLHAAIIVCEIVIVCACMCVCACMHLCELPCT